MLDRFGHYLSIYWNARVEKGGVEYRFNCPNPICNDLSGHFSFNIEVGVSNCWKCGYNPTPYRFLVVHGKMSPKEARDLLADFAFHKQKEGVNHVDVVEKIKIPDSTIPVNQVTGGLAALLKEWLKDSGITMKAAMNLGFGVDISKTSQSFGRIIIPVYENNEQVYWVGRAMLDSVEFPYWFPGGRKGLYVWGLDTADISDGFIYVSEGWKDAYKMRGVALLGNSMTDDQFKKILSYTPDSCGISIMLDIDAFKEARKVAFNVYRKCKGQRIINLYNITKFKDPGLTSSREEALKHSLVFHVNSLTGRVKARIQRSKKLFK